MQRSCGAKRRRVQDALTRLGGADLQVEEIIGAKDPTHYRNKSQYPVGADGSIGFYQARSHRVVPIRSCLIQSEVSDPDRRGCESLDEAVSCFRL